MADQASRFNPSAWAVRNQQLVAFFMLLIMATGLYCYQQLPRNEDPAFTIKTAVISASWPGANVSDMTNLVTDALEKKIQELPRLDVLESYTRPGQSVIFVNLADSTPPSEVPGLWYSLRKKMMDVAPSLPQGVNAPAVDDEFDDTYGTIYGFTSEGFSPRELRDKVDDVRDELLKLPDVGKITVLGAEEEQVVVAFSARKLASLGLSLQQVSSALQAQNAITPAGEIRTRDDLIGMRVSGAFVSEQSLRQVVLRIGQRFVPLHDIATIGRQSAEPPSPTFRVNGQAAIGLAISMSHTGNMLRFGQEIRDKMAQIGTRLPHGIEVVSVADQSVVVKDSVNSFLRVLLEAVLIVLAVSFVSLGTRAGLVVAASIPLVLAMTFIGMDIAGIGMQRISLGALIIALGLLVDDAMIAVEAMVAQLERGIPLGAAATIVWHTTAFPMLTGTMVMIAGFIPVGFAASSAGEYCYSLFVVVMISLLCSWVVAVLFSPLLGVWILRGGNYQHSHESGRLAKAYRRLLFTVLRHRGKSLAIACAALALSIAGGTQLKSEFFPASDRPELLVSLSLPQNATQAATQREVERLEAILRRDPDVERFSSYVGSGAVRFYLPMDVLLGNENIAQLVVVAKNLHQRDRLQARLNSVMETSFSSLVTRVSPLELGPPVGWPLKYRVSGPDVGRVREVAAGLASLIGKNPDAREVNLTAGEPRRAVKVELNQTEARAVGISSEDVSSRLAMLYSGATITSIRDGHRLLDVVARGTDSDRNDLQTLADLQLANSDGKNVPLQQIATLGYGIEEPIIWRRQRVPFITVQTDIASGVLASALSAQLAPDIARYRASLPVGYRIEEGGTVDESNKGNDSIYSVLPVTLLVMLMLLMIQLRRFSRMLVALLAAPFGYPGVVLAMMPTGTPMGFVALLGLIALSGMIIRNAVILISEVDGNLRAGASPSRAIVRAATHRARPILLTAAAAILGSRCRKMGAEP